MMRSGLVLDGAGGGDVALFDQLVHADEQLRHDGVGAADAAISTHGTARNKLLIGTVKDGKAILAAGGDTGVLEQLDVLRGHRGVLDGNDLGFFSISCSSGIVRAVPASCGML